MKKAALFLLALYTLTGITGAQAQQAASAGNTVQQTAYSHIFTVAAKMDKSLIRTVENTGLQQQGVTFCMVSFKKQAAQPYFRLNAIREVSANEVQAWLQPAGITVTKFFGTGSDEARQFLHAHP